MTPSEEYVSQLCEKSFLPFWSFPNPIGRNNKELCDVLIVCERYIIIISIKDIQVSKHKDEKVNYDRWVKKAIKASIDQIFGAERYLNSVDEFYLKDRTTKIKLPPKETREIYRIAVAFGSKPNYPLPSGKFKKGFVSVFDEVSTFILLSELDTITDFTDYLRKKEQFVSDKKLIVPSEADLLAVYLSTALEFEFDPNLFSVMEGTWLDYKKSIEYAKWIEEINISFIWDNIIKTMFNHHIKNEASTERRDEIVEAVLKISLETRQNRIALGEALQQAIDKGVSARMLKPPFETNHAYVFMLLNDNNWKGKESELKLRCFVAKKENPQAETIIGLAIGSNSDGESIFDICYLYIPDMDNKFIETANKIQNEFNYFKNPTTYQNFSNQ